MLASSLCVGGFSAPPRSPVSLLPPSSVRSRPGPRPASASRPHFGGLCKTTIAFPGLGSGSGIQIPFLRGYILLASTAGLAPNLPDALVQPRHAHDQDYLPPWRTCDEAPATTCSCRCRHPIPRYRSGLRPGLISASLRFQQSFFSPAPCP